MSSEEELRPPRSPTVPLTDGPATEAPDGADGDRALPRAPRVGDDLAGRYRLLELIGQGGMGQVFRAADRTAEEVVAIKFLAATAARSPRNLERFRRELRAARKIAHPNVVRLHDLIEADGRLALTMELVEGEDLARRLRRKARFEPGEVEALLRDVAAALAAAHQAGVVHRDVKPGNIILRRTDGRAVITDFGVSRLGEATSDSSEETTTSPDHGLTREGDMVGTPPYMAPEQLRRQRDTTAAADVYATGLVVFEAATGMLPHDDSVADLLTGAARRLREPAPRLGTLRPDLPPALCAIVDRCLERDPARRYASGVELRAALDRASGKRRPPLRLIAAAAAVALVTAGVAAGLWLHGRLPARGRRVAFVAEVAAGSGGDAWLGRAAVRLAARRLGDRERRVAVTDRPEDANVVVRLALRRAHDRVSIDARIGDRPIGSAAAPSLSAALDEVLSEAQPLLAAGQAERPADTAERATMQRLGATSFEAYRLYQAAVTEFFSAVSYDSLAMKARGEGVLRLDPAWAHAHALLLYGEWEGTREQRVLLERLDGTPRDPARDPAGELILEALRKGNAAEGPLIERLAALERERPDDVLLGWALAEKLLAHKRRAEEIELLRRMHAARPDLQFGADLARILREEGREAEADQVVERWFEAAPDCEQALASVIALELRRGRFAEAWQHARDLVLLHGEASHRLATLCDALISGERTREAHEVASRLVSGDDLSRVRGRRRLGEVAILEGRLGAAWESLQAALEQGRPHGMSGEVTQTLESLRALAPIVGRDAEVADLTRELAAMVESVGDGGTALALRAEAAAAGAARPCQALTPKGIDQLNELRASIARRQLARARAARGCGTCREALALGLSTSERSTAAILRFADCAEREGDLELALRAYRLAQEQYVRTLTDGGANLASAVHAVLARFHAARLLARQGKARDARAEYEAFLRLWGRADRPLPEVAAAGKALAELGR